MMDDVESGLESSLPVVDRRMGAGAVPTVSARLLYEFLEAGRNFTNWIKGRIEQYGLTEGEDFLRIEHGELGTPIRAYQDCARHGGDRRSVDYALTLDVAKELCMVENNAKGRQARRYFLWCERRLRSSSSSVSSVPASVDLNDARALRALLGAYVERVVGLEERVAFDAPKVEGFGKFMDARTSVPVEVFVKRMASIGYAVGRTRCFRWMREQSIIVKNRALPYQRWIDAGYFTIRETVQTVRDGSTRIREQALITPRGQVWLADQLALSYGLLH